jgi:hypothetical protein
VRHAAARLRRPLEDAAYDVRQVHGADHVRSTAPRRSSRRRACGGRAPARTTDTSRPALLDADPSHHHPSPHLRGCHRHRDADHGRVRPGIRRGPPGPYVNHDGSTVTTGSRRARIDRMQQGSIVESFGPLHGPGRRRSHASAGQPCLIFCESSSHVYHTQTCSGEVSLNPHGPVLYGPAERAVCILKKFTTAHSSTLHISLCQSRPSPGFITPVPKPSASG